MLVFNLKKEWFDKIKNGEKTHEYREVKPFWTKRISKYFKIEDKFKPIEDSMCEFVCGYAKKSDAEKRLKGKIKDIKIVEGLNTDLKVNAKVYDIAFELIERRS